MKSVLLIALIIAALLPLAPSYAKRGRGAPTQNQNTQKTTPYWEISSVDSTSNSVVLEMSDKSSSVTLTINSATKITANGVSAKLADLQNGMKVTYVASGTICASLDAVAASTQKKTGKKNK